MTTDPFDPLFAAFAGNEPEELRNSYLAVPDPGRVIGPGSTTPLLGGYRMEPRSSGLLVPSQTQGSQMLDMAKPYMTMDMLFGGRLGPDAAQVILAGHSTETLVGAGAWLMANFYETHPTDAGVHRRLAEPLSDQERQRAQALINEGWMFLAPQAVLGVMKIALLLEPHEGSRHPDEAVSHAVLLSLDLAAELGSERSEGGESFWAGTGYPTSLVIDTIQNQLFNHFSDVGSTLARYRRTRELAARFDPRRAAQFDSVFEEATGCSPDVFFVVAMRLLVQLQTGLIVRVDPAIFDQLQLPPEQVAAALDLLCADESTLRSEVRREFDRCGLSWASNAMRRYPVMRCANGDLLVLNRQFLIERMCGSAFFFEVQGELKRRKRSSSRRSGGKPDGELDGAFQGFTGRVAEEYAADRLEHIAPNSGVLGQQLWREDELRQFWPPEVGKCCDFLIDAGSSWVAIDVVNHAITESAAAKGDEAALERDLTFVIDEKATQLDETIRRLIGRGGSLPGQADRAATPRYHPVIIASAGFPWSPLMAPAAHVRLRESGVLQDPRIYPLTVLTTEDLEHVESAVEQGVGTFPEMLDRRLASGEGGVAFDTYLSHQARLDRPSSLGEPLEKVFADLAEALGLNPSEFPPPNTDDGTNDGG